MTGYNLVEVWRSTDWVETRGTPIVGDLDGDGDLEIVVNNTNDYAFIYKNSSVESQTGNSIQVLLKGPKNNLNGIGTKIEITTPDGLKTSTVVNPMKGYLSSHDKKQVIGIGKNLFLLNLAWVSSLLNLFLSLYILAVHMRSWTRLNYFVLIAFLFYANEPCQEVDTGSCSNEKPVIFSGFLLILVCGYDSPTRGIASSDLKLHFVKF